VTHELQATESLDASRALERLPAADAHVAKVLARVEPFAPVPPGGRVLDIGAAQGTCVTAFNRAGYAASGVEPWMPALEVSRELARQTGIETDIVHGQGESLPFEDDFFDFVQAQSVLEHVVDPLVVFREAHRVLRPGGSFYFYTTSALCPRQGEIRRFPLFPWYPRRLQRAIMRWATERHPGLVGHTETPAVHWFTPWGVRRDLAAAGFSRTLDRWESRRDEELSGWRSRVLRAARRHRSLRLIGDVLVPSSSYVAIK
jgi:SAM-dependent methyltransferase